MTVHITGTYRHARAAVCSILIAFVLAFSPAASELQIVCAASSSTEKTKNKSKKKKSKTARSKKKSTNKTTAESKSTGFVKKSGKWYYYDADHKPVTGWITVGKRRYYGKKKGSGKGSLLTGWQKIGGKEYYFAQSGGKGKTGKLYAGGTKKVNGIACEFDENGVFTGCKYAGSRSGFVNRVGEMARENQRKNNILATVVVAQAILETGYGKVVPHHNLFGLYRGRYSSEQACFNAYNAYIRRYFASLVGCRSYSVYARRIGNGGYAQAPGYGSALLQIVRRDGLTRFAR